VDRGYVPYLEKVPAFSAATAEGSQFSASHTLEYSFSSWAAAQFAQALGKAEEHRLLLGYSKGWEQLFDADTGFIRPKDAGGQFLLDFDPRRPWVGFQEGNAWQYTFYVPHDLPGLIQKMGLDTFRERLDEVFSQAEKTEFGGGKKLDAFSGLQNVYNHGNQPALHIAWLFNSSGRPWLTQHWIRRICDVFYGTDRVHGYGYGQDEDQGQLGAWFVLASLGLFDIQGGTAPQPVFQLATPFFQQIVIQLQPRYFPGKTFTIRVKGDPASDHYIQSATLNGLALKKCTVPWEQVVRGGTLEVTTQREPEKRWPNQ
jgi:predicted alpha-1,2-mannosidase